MKYENKVFLPKTFMLILKKKKDWQRKAGKCSSYINRSKIVTRFPSPWYTATSSIRGCQNRMAPQNFSPMAENKSYQVTDNSSVKYSVKYRQF